MNHVSFMMHLPHIRDTFPDIYSHDFAQPTSSSALPVFLYISVNYITAIKYWLGMSQSKSKTWQVSWTLSVLHVCR